MPKKPGTESKQKLKNLLSKISRHCPLILHTYDVEEGKGSDILGSRSSLESNLIPLEERSEEEKLAW
jgi:hypothetical protein